MDPEDARAALEQRRAALLHEDRVDEQARAPVELDQESVGRLSRMDAMQVQQMARALEQRRKAERARIDAALDRLAAGEWGYCVACGDEIARPRLVHDPSVSHCIKCAS
ncbi:TraR/DksA family transcriptional regulator [Sphingomicrobium astaxanthinifaciens]|uniref:TraR/DksA family transcriptional regulator n=1 Tax=Sphingomicrobium astaxanthinifaciens TaxID=1227949 RepID=UPI001FCC95DE|nr:TraR/DksA C4-type zinc finger protein [Sphingomicrobium astaxanthinifaciens]MCJ7420586.1 TraR/DksA C4-type zinc finger protein [Sphingomicrobium astaxanthinifaciens]